MRMIQVLLLILAMGCLSAVASAQSVSATVLISLNVIPACSVNYGGDFSSDQDMDKNIHCGQNSIHRISYHKGDSQHQRKHVEFERDHDKRELTTIEF